MTTNTLPSYTILTTGAASTGPFAFSFTIYATGDLKVVRRSAAGVDTTLVLTTEYTISAGPWPTGGTVTLVSALQPTEALLLRSNVGTDQALHLIDGDDMPAADLEDALDRLSIGVKQVEEAQSRMLQLQQSSAIRPPIIKDPTSGLNRVLTWNGASFEFVDIATLAPATLVVSAYAQTLLDDTDAATARLTLGAIGNLKSIQVFTITGANTYTKPAGLKYGMVFVCAGGSAGAGAVLTPVGQSSAGVGGAAGGWALKFIDASLIGSTESVQVGAGGVGAAGAAGGSGGSSSFGAHASATTGTAGVTVAAGAGVGGANGRQGGIGSSGNLNFRGGSSPFAWRDGSLGYGSGGGDSPFGGGGVGVIIGGSAAGAAGSGFGAGGGGGANGPSQAATAGGNGAQGFVMVWEFY